MKSIKHISILLLVATAMFITACEKNEADTEKPEIIINTPTNGMTLYAGDHIDFDAEFSDDVELNQYKIDIHDNFDAHSHKAGKSEGTPWHYQQSWTFEPGVKNAHIQHHDIEIPSEIDGQAIAPGKYHLTVYCTDKAGNESWKAIEIHIEHREKN